MNSKTLPISTYRFGDLTVPCVQIGQELYHMPVTCRGKGPLGPYELTDVHTPIDDPRILHVSDDGVVPVLEGSHGEVAIILPEKWPGEKILAGRSWEDLRWCTNVFDAWLALTDTGMMSVPVGHSVQATTTDLLPSINQTLQGRSDYAKLMGRVS